ncbi:MAG: M48 family metallopeptidase [Halothiobacillaceae bacterium]
MATIELGDITAEVVRKEIKHIHLVVYPPHGRVRITAPQRYKLDMLRVFAINKLGWIQTQRRKMQAQEREAPRAMLERESHQVWGMRRLLKIEVVDAAPSVELRPRTLVLRVRADADHAKREAVLQAWYRHSLREAVAELLPKWEKRLGVKVSRVFVQTMRTRWGSCNPDKANIRLNTELAKKPPSCLEYVLVHELLHLIEHRHSPRFRALLDRHLPGWEGQRDVLNALPVK